MDNLKGLEEKLRHLIDELKYELATIRTNRPTPKLLEDIKVDYMEQQMAVKQMGSISIELPRNLIITPWDQESTKSISKAIESANIGVTSAVQGSVVRVSLPELTNERREELSRLVKDISEKIRIKMRTIRDEVHKKINQEPDEDDKFRYKEKLQKAVDSFNKEIDESISTKLNEIMN